MSIKGSIATAVSTTGELAATVDALHWQQDGQWTQLPWHQIARATWSSESTSFVIYPVSGGELEWSLQEAGRLPEAARERITSTIVAQDQITVPGVGMVMIIFRHVDGQILAQTMPQVDSPLISARISQVSAELGIG